MKNTINAYEILEKISRIENDFVINQDINLTKNVKDKINETNWQSLKEKNSDKLIKSLNLENEQLRDDVFIDTKWSEYNVEVLDENKNITQCLPGNTRFKPVKKLMNRMMMVSLRYQEIFNNAAVNLMNQLVKKINKLNSEFTESNNIVYKMKSEIEHYSIKEEIIKDEIESIKKSASDEIENINKSVSCEIESIKKLLRYEIEKNEEYFHVFDKRLKEFDSLYDEINVCTNEYKNSFNDINKQVDSNEDLLKNLYEAIRNQEMWLKNVSDKVENNEKWLNMTNIRIDGQEKWLGTTNKRIDSCNEMLSISPEIGYQSFSQAGEDVIVMHILSKIKTDINKISYLDIGCNHYKNFNNTYRLYQKGYCGVLVEANPMLIEDIKKNRPRDIVINNGIGTNSEEVLDFYIINGGGLSSFNKKAINDAISNDSDAYIEKIEKIKIITFNEIVEKYFDEVPNVVSIDIEGDEYSVLDSIDFNRYRPLVFIVETIEYRKNLTIGTKRNDIIEVMKLNGYSEYAFTGINSIFIDVNKVNVERLT